jgi:Glycosyl transferase family 2
MKVDVHVLLLPDTLQNWWDECRMSLRDEPITLHEVSGVKGHVGKARANGFRHGESPYVSFVDPDDLVIPGAFQACLDVLEQNPEACGAYTDEMLISAEGKELNPGLWSGRPWNPLLMLEPKYMHHILVMRRKFVQPHLEEIEEKWPNMAEFVLKGLLCQYGPWIHVDRFGYKWRMPPQGVKPTHKQMPVMGVYAARWRIIPILYQAARKYGAEISAVVETTDGFPVDLTPPM